MNIDIQKIRDGECDGQVVYVCDLRFTNYMNKPIRHIKPTKVLVRSNEELQNKTIYYSASHFIGLNKNDTPLKSKVIAPFDNTGYRGYTGVSLQVFDNMDECAKYYNKMCKQAVKGLKVYKNNVVAEIEEKIKIYSK